MSLHIAFFVFPGFALLDMSGPLCAFKLANYDFGGAYRMTVVSEAMMADLVAAYREGAFAAYRARGGD